MALMSSKRPTNEEDDRLSSLPTALLEDIVDRLVVREMWSVWRTSRCLRAIVQQISWKDCPLFFRGQWFCSQAAIRMFNPGCIRRMNIVWPSDVSDSCELTTRPASEDEIRRRQTVLPLIAAHAPHLIDLELICDSFLDRRQQALVVNTVFQTTEENFNASPRVLAIGSTFSQLQRLCLHVFELHIFQVDIELPMLSKLELNGFGAVDGNWVVRLPNLTHLSLLYLSRKVTCLPELEYGVWPRLSHVKVGGGSLLSLPASWFTLPALQELEVKGCDHLEHIPDIPVLPEGYRAPLQELRLTFCVSLTELPSTLVQLQELRLVKAMNCDDLHVPDGFGDGRIEVTIEEEDDGLDLIGLA